MFSIQNTCDNFLVHVIQKYITIQFFKINLHKIVTFLVVNGGNKWVRAYASLKYVSHEIVFANQK